MKKKDTINRYKANYKLTVIHKAVIIVLLTMGIFFLIKPNIYRMRVEYNPAEVTIPFLKAGDYEVKITYSGASQGAFAVASSDLLADSENHMGVEFARTELNAEIRDVAVMNVHLEQGTYGVCIRPEQTDECFEEVRIQRVQLLDRDHYFLFAVCILSALCMALLGWYVPVEKYKNALLLVGMGLAASIPMYSDFLPKGHDMLFHLARMEGLYQGLRNGEFPVRLNPVQTELFGNLTATMYPQLFLYPAVLPRFLDVSVMLCYKLLVVCMNVVTAMLTFYGVRRITGSEKMAYTASALYTFALYRLTNTYLRAALGETLAMVFLPLVLWGVYEVLWGDRRKWYLLTLGVTCVLQSHIMSVMMAVLFLVLEAVAWLVKSVRGKTPGKELAGRIAAGIKAAAATCLLNAGFLIPFLYFRGEKLLCFAWDFYLANYEGYFSQMFSLFPSATGNAVMKGTTEGEMPVTVGGILAVGAILFLVAVYREKARSRTLSFGMHCLVYGGISLLMTSTLFPWEAVGENPFLHDLTTPLQYSWRFLGTASLCLCVVSAVGVVTFVSQSGGRNWILGVYMAVALCSAWYFFDSISLQMDSLNDEMALEGNMEYDSLYMYDDREFPEFTELAVGPSENYIKTLHDTPVRYSDYQKRGTDISTYVAPERKPQEDEYLLFPLYYYPGYEITVNGQEVEAVSQGRLLACRLPEEEAFVQVEYKGMNGWRIADIVSLVTAMGIAVYVVRQRITARKGMVQR
ncbi:MAG: YfhO family protein [Acetatifactor sp.]|nr:YfhO family protein [Acetatifactor sp.]